MKNLNNSEKMMVDAICEAYIQVMGIEKWNSLGEVGQHDVIMTIVKDLNKALN